MKRRRSVLQALLLTGAICTLSVFPALAETVVLDRKTYARDLAGMKVQFMARDLEDGREYVLSGSDLDTRHSPFSTFKIPNMLIALDTGVASSPDHWREWNRKRRPPEAFWPDGWKQGQTLKTAFARSAVWYFQDLALEIGAASYRNYLTKWGYGNAEVPEGSDTFWLGEGLRVSTREQVDFLDNLLSGKLDVSQRHLNALHEASYSGSQGSLRLHGKTGAGPDQGGAWDGPFSGWYVGYLQRAEARPVVFALHVSAPSFSALASFRKTATIKLLKEADLVATVEFKP